MGGNEDFGAHRDGAEADESARLRLARRAWKNWTAWESTRTTSTPPNNWQPIFVFNVIRFSPGRPGSLSRLAGPHPAILLTAVFQRTLGRMRRGVGVNENVIQGTANDRAGHLFSRAVQEHCVRT